MTSWRHLSFCRLDTKPPAKYMQWSCWASLRWSRGQTLLSSGRRETSWPSQTAHGWYRYDAWARGLSMRHTRQVPVFSLQPYLPLCVLSCSCSLHSKTTATSTWWWNTCRVGTWWTWWAIMMYQRSGLAFTRPRLCWPWTGSIPWASFTGELGTLLSRNTMQLSRNTCSSIQFRRLLDR